MRMDRKIGNANPGIGAPADAGRRDFVAVSAAAALAMAVGAASAAESGGPAQPDSAVVEQDVRIPTDDGACDAAFFHPAQGSGAGVLLWSDAFGLRPALRKMARRLAGEGYCVLVPNPFYRTSAAAGLGDLTQRDFAKDEDRAHLMQLMGTVTAPGAAERDAKALVAFLRSRREVDAHRPIGVQGYCMGGPLSFRTAAAESANVRAVASFHGGGLVTEKPASPHLLAPRIHARIYVGIAGSDDERQPDAKDRLREAFSAAAITAEVEVYAGAQHGWCMPDLPPRGGKAIYSAQDAERAWGKLLDLYRGALA
jgi:carboxymethylenebutenolidase